MRTSKLVSLSLPPKLLEEADRFAQKETRSRSELFREAIRRYIKHQSHKTVIPNPNNGKALMHQTFLQGDVNRIFGYISHRTLHSLAVKNVIDWVDERHDRRGVHRIYSLANCYQIAVATQLALTGLSYPNIKTLVMDKYFKGFDTEGNPKILGYMSKLLGIKIGETKFTYEQQSEEKELPFINYTCEVLGIKKLKLKLGVDKLKDKLSGRRIPLYEVLFAEPENIHDLVEYLNKPFQSMFLKTQPLSISVINLPRLAKKVEEDIKTTLENH